MGKCWLKGYIVGLRQGKRSEVLTIEAEDALLAALKVKHNHPEALISYVRKSNRRGDPAWRRWYGDGNEGSSIRIPRALRDNPSWPL